MRQSVEQPRRPADFAVTAYRTNTRWVSLTMQGVSDRDFGPNKPMAFDPQLSPLNVVHKKM